MAYRSLHKRVAVTEGDRYRAGNLCITHRQAANLSQAQLAAALGCRQTVLSALENFDKRAPTWLVRKVLDTLTLPPAAATDGL